ncbi:polysaccharide deacetylase family protein [Paenibacillus sp. SC116]|uniref:polysaccharide deacetylase family protein n=1 Tax=Paenibacillus sp. SC116 TaxID=2968986 RepID=UPI00215A5526|nr:polysaccharide deacetylase family protein [Paenibacillus sp. SC116]MCR8844613.1 polysaccharide deacetylase family protein [Paenibacillus sp. SC116]
MVRKGYLRKGLFTILLFAVMTAGCYSNSSTNETSNTNQAKSVKNNTIKEYKLVPNGAPELAGGSESKNRNTQSLTLEQLRKKYRSNFHFSGPSTPPRVALTFDDAPDQLFTPRVLDVLNEYKVKATFFVVGNRAQKHPDIIDRIVKEGHILGNHTYNHPNLAKVSNTAFQREVVDTQKTIKKLTGKTMRYLRPPYGNITEEQIKWLVSKKISIVNWNVDSLDWKGLNADQVVANVMGDVKAGSIVLQHSAGGEGEDLSGTIQALPRIIKQLRDQGIELVTVPELLKKPAYK